MTKKERALDRFARDLCWAGFSGSYRPAGGKTKYWKTVSLLSKTEYIRDARMLLWTVRRLGIPRVEKAIAEAAE